MGRTDQLPAAAANGRFRRIFLLAAHPGEGPLTEPTAAARAWRPELVFMPQSGLPTYMAGASHSSLGGTMAVQDEAADHELVEQFFAERRLSAARVPETMTKTPDYRILRELYT